MRALCRVLTAALVLSASLPALAQYSIGKIDIRGGAPYTDAELLSVAGLQPGQFLTHDSLAQAAQHLLDTGLFDDTEISLSGQDKARTVLLDLKPKPIATLLPASFENFVWSGPEELAAAIHARVPLYRGVFSDAGNLPDLVQAALQQILAAKGIAATVSYAIVEPTTQHPLRVVDFKIEQPSVRLASVTVTGAPAALAAAMRSISARAAGSSYNEGLSGVTTEDVLLSPARNAGYIAAKLDSVQRTATPSSQSIGVAYTAQLQAGSICKVAGIAWSATPIYSAADFAKDTMLHSGDLAAASALTATENRVLIAYRAQGYLDAYLDPSPTLDDTAHTVAYALHAIPGTPYRLHSVTPLNLSPEARQEFDSSWRMKPGDVYNESYVKSFITNNNALPHVALYSGAFQAAADPQTHLVDLTINFVAPGDPH